MQQSGPREPAALKSALNTPLLWEDLEHLCEALLCLSKKVEAALRRGAGAAELVPLLRQEVDLAGQLRAGIAQCARQRGLAPSGECRQHLAGRLRSLLKMEQANHGLLGRRGIRLRTPRFCPAPSPETCP